MADTPHIAFRGRYLDVIWEDGAEYTHNRRSRGVILVIPVTDAGETVFIEQYRVPLKGPVIAGAPLNASAVIGASYAVGWASPQANPSQGGVSNSSAAMWSQSTAVAEKTFAGVEASSSRRSVQGADER